MPGAGPSPAAPPRDEGQGPEARDQRAAFQVTEQTRTYPCRQCGAQLVFDITKQQLACLSCGFAVDIDTSQLDAPMERDLGSTVAQIRAMAAKVEAPQVTGQKEIVCQNCGGHTTFSGTLTAVRCPYCATPIQRDDVHEAPARIAVDGLLPFVVDRKVAEANLDKWINSRWFAPTEFKKYNETGSFQSVYTAYFTYDSDTRTFYQGERGDHYTVTVGSGDNQRTETRTRWSPRSGQVANDFDDITVLANDGIDRGRIKALEPWPTETAKAFSPEYVAGHLSRTYDRDVEQCYPEAKSIMDSEIRQTVRRDIGGDEQKIHRLDTKHLTLMFKHLLLPIWLLTVIYEGKPFQVYINGVTGEVQGQRPWSKVKLAAAIIGAIVVVILGLIIYNSVGGSK
ncbi:MAG: hypothetical protein ABI239_09160 [Aquihabitans sp.]